MSKAYVIFLFLAFQKVSTKPVLIEKELSLGDDLQRQITKRQICDHLDKHHKLKCANPIIINCPNHGRFITCGAEGVSDAILGAHQILSDGAHVAPFRPPSALSNFRILRAQNTETEEERKLKQTRVFDGFLKFATVVNQIDTFVTDKGKVFLKALGKMVESEEDPRLD